MQFIDGIPLQEAIKRLNLEQKVVIFKKISQALQEAHKKGFIHRDIKPSNILIEFKDDGEIKPYIIDFGLVREIERSELSFPGTIIGTIGYMAPEQIKGNFEEIDRRTDIYGLGLTMYFALSGKKPFDIDEMDGFEKFIEKEIIPLKKINKDIPRDLEAIILKCTEKEKSERYQSAKELQEDLENFLKGEPESAKLPNFAYIFLKKIKKNKIFFFFSLVLMALILIFSLYSVHIKNIERKQRALAIEFSQQAKYIEDMLWYIYSSKIHNIKPQIELAREKVLDFERGFKSYGEIGSGPGYYALGKCYISLGNFKKAIEYLEIAQNKYKFKTSDMPYLIALSNIMVFFEEKERVLRIEDPDLKEKELKKIENKYLKKAERFLEESKREEIEAWEFLEALKAFIKKNYRESLKKIEITKEKLPWLFENLKLEGKIYKSIAEENSLKGEKEKALEYFNKAENSFLKIKNLRESDPEVYKLLSSLYLSQMDLKIYQSAEAPDELYEKIQEKVNILFLLNMDTEEAYKILSYTNMKMGNYYMYQGKSPLKYFENSILFAKNSLIINAKDPYIFPILGSAYHSSGVYKRSIGQNPEEEFKYAEENYKKALSISPNDIDTLNNLASNFWNRGAYELEIGKNPENSFKEGIKYIKRAIKIEPHHASFYNLLGNLNLDYSNWKILQKENPFKELNEAVSCYEKAIKINPNFAFSYNNLAKCIILKLENGFYKEDEIFKEIQRASYFLEKALKIKEDFIWTYITYLRLEIFKIKLNMKENKSPDEDFKIALELIEKGEKIEKYSLPLNNQKIEIYKLKKDWEKNLAKD